jgi:hypothetical protein
MMPVFIFLAVLCIAYTPMNRQATLMASNINYSCAMRISEQAID